MRALITERLARGAKPAADGKPYDIRDTAIPGFTLRVLGSGSRSWTLIYSLGGHRRRMDLGRYPWLDAPRAREQARAAHALVRAGTDPQAAAEPATKGVTVRALCALYIDLYAKRHKRSWRGDQSLIAAYVLPTWGDREAVSVTRRELREVFDQVAATRPTQANRLHSLVSRLFSWAVESDHLPASPMFRLPKPAAERPRSRVLTDAEVAAVWRACDADTSALAKILPLMLLTGQRGGEIRQLAYADVAGGWWNMPVEIVKNKRPHRVYLSASAMAIISGLRRRRTQTHAFPTYRWKAGEAPAKNPQRVFQRVAATAGLARPWTAHDLRRTAATKLAQLGVSRLVVDRVLNHVDRSVTAVYDLYRYDRELTEAMETLAAEWALVLAAH